jgi:hypothetical protein
MLAKGVLDMQTVYSIQTTLDFPTALTLVVFSLLSIKLEFDKPKYRQLLKSRGSIGILIYGAGALIVLALIYLKYFM